MIMENLVLEACVNMLREDSLSAPLRALWKTSERNISSYLASALRDQKSLSRYQVDTEYNREGMGNDPKIMLETDGRKSLVVPDILVHKRGIPDKNHLCIEVKKIRRFGGSLNRKDIQRDLKNCLGLRNIKDMIMRFHWFFQKKKYGYARS